MTIHVVPSESLTAVCVDCGNGLFGGPPCEHKVKRAKERAARALAVGDADRANAILAAIASSRIQSNEESP